MYAVTLDTAARGVEASLADVARASGRLIWASKIVLPFLTKKLLKGARAVNKDFAKTNLELLEMAQTLPLQSAELVDPELVFRGRLDKIKAHALEFRTKLLNQRLTFKKAVEGHSIFQSSYTAAFVVEIDRSIALCQEMFEIANKIQWDMAEHDADFSVRHEGFTADSAESVMELLGRL